MSSENYNNQFNENFQGFDLEKLKNYVVKIEKGIKEKEAKLEASKKHLENLKSRIQELEDKSS